MTFKWLWTLLGIINLTGLIYCCTHTYSTPFQYDQYNANKIDGKYWDIPNEFHEYKGNYYHDGIRYNVEETPDADEWIADADVAAWTA